jgi:pyrimidine dimer DNA glycosylase
MQTFLPYDNFEKCAKCLDMRRLGKQRVECLQLIRALLNGGTWCKHPAAKMWKGYELALMWYGCEICNEWISRGYKDTCKQKILDEFNICNQNVLTKDIKLPNWIGSKIHITHRSALLAKNIEHYKQFNWSEEPKIDYYWPVT